MEQSVVERRDELPVLMRIHDARRRGFRNGVVAAVVGAVVVVALAVLVVLPLLQKYYIVRDDYGRGQRLEGLLTQGQCAEAAKATYGRQMGSDLVGGGWPTPAEKAFFYGCAGYPLHTGSGD